MKRPILRAFTLMAVSAMAFIVTSMTLAPAPARA